MKTLVVVVLSVAIAGCGGKPRIEPLTTVAALEPLVPSELKFTPNSPPDNDNGYLLMVKAGTLLDKPSAKDPVLTYSSARLDPATRRRAESVLAKNKKALEVLEQAAAKEVWFGKYDSGAATLFAELAEVKSMAKLLVLQARVDLAKGRPGEAANALIEAHAVGNRLLGCQSSIIHFLVGVAILAIADKAVRELAWDPAMNAGAIRKLQAALKNSPSSDALVGQIKAEFHNLFLFEMAKMQGPTSSFFADFSLSPENGAAIARSLEGHPHPFDREATVREGSRYYVEMIANAKRPWSKQVDLEADQEKLLASWPPDFFGDKVPSNDEIQKSRIALQSVKNPFGKLLVGFSVSIFGTHLIEFKRRMNEDLTRSVLANRLYAMSHGGRNAPSVEALRLGALDPFSDKPYRYDARRGLVWSVGKDGKDDGGKDKPGILTNEAKDWVVSVRG